MITTTAGRLPETRRFQRRVVVSVLLPVVTLLAFSVLLALEIRTLVHDSALLDRSDRILAETAAVEKLHVDLETGLRGTLLTGDERFLQPYVEALPRVDPAIESLQELVNEDEVQPSRVETLQERSRAWRALALQLLDDRQAGRSIAWNARGKDLMDSVRAALASIRGAELSLRESRGLRQRVNATRTVLVGTAAVALLGLVFGLSSLRQLQWASTVFGRSLREARDLASNLEQRVAERTEALARANEELETFSYSISHDLRAPLRRIDGFAEMLHEDLGPALHDPQRQTLERIRVGARRMSSLVDALLTLSRGTRADIRRTDLDLSALSRSVVDELQQRADTGAVVTISPGLRARADPVLLRTLLENLLGNAFKFVPPAERPRVEVGSLGEGTFFVRDHGMGFDATQAQDRVFLPFQRLAPASGVEGTGIGLATARRIVERHGGRIWAESAPGRGATFFFTLGSH
jgi:signal transduction histidine kinase